MTELDLFNLALAPLGREISEAEYEGEDPSRELRLCRQHLALARIRVMREFDWSCLTVKLDMDWTDDEPGFGFAHGYLLPYGVFKIIGLAGDGPYRVVGERLYTDEDAPEVHGIMTGWPESGVPEDLHELAAYALGYLVVPVLAPEAKLEQLLLQRYTWCLGGLTSAEARNNRKAAPGRPLWR